LFISWLRVVLEHSRNISEEPILSIKREVREAEMMFYAVNGKEEKVEKNMVIKQTLFNYVKFLW
jgi:hypothetical protein